MLLAGCATHLAWVEATKPSPPTTFIAGVSVFDGEVLLVDQDVLLGGDRVLAMGATGTVPGVEGATRVNGGGRTLLPGLIDLHVHIDANGEPWWRFRGPVPEANAAAYAAAGVTSVLVARHSGSVDRLAERGTEGKRTHLFLAGPSLTAPRGHPIPYMKATLPWPVSTVFPLTQPTASNPAEARAQVRTVAEAHHPPFYKVYYDDFPSGSPRLNLETLSAAMDEARARGMRPIVHVGSGRDAVEAAEAGAALLMHSPYEALLTADEIDALARAQVPFVTTLRCFSGAFEIVADGPTPFERAFVAPATLDAYPHPPARIPGMVARESARFVENGRNEAANTLSLRAAGVPFLVGTDGGVPGVFPGAGLHHEIEALVHLGIPEQEVLAAATSRAAAFLDPSGGFGRVAPGQRADLLLVRGDPTTDIMAIDVIEAVWLDGVRLEPHLVGRR